MKFTNMNGKVRVVKPIRPLTDLEKGWKEFTNTGDPGQAAAITFDPALFFFDHFTARQSSSGLLNAIRSSGITIPDGRDDLERLNNLLACRGLHYDFQDLTLCNAADKLLKRVHRLSDKARIKLNRYILESAYPECPRSLTPPGCSVSKENIDARLTHFFRKLNTTHQTFFQGTVYLFIFYEPNKSRSGYHIHIFIQGIHKSLASDLQLEMNKHFGNCDVAPHYRYGVIFKHDFLKSFYNFDLVISRMVDLGWVRAVDYKGKPGYVVNQDLEKIKGMLLEEFPLDAEIIIAKMLAAKDGARYMAKKDPTKYLGFDAFPVTARRLPRLSINGSFHA